MEPSATAARWRSVLAKTLPPLLLLVSVPALIQGYNVDVQNVAVYRGPDEAMFGFSVSGYTDRDSSW